MRLPRDIPVYHRLENLSPYELKSAIETELHCRAYYPMYCKQYDVQINHYSWKPEGLRLADERGIEIPVGKRDYFKAVLLLKEYHDRYRPEENLPFVIDSIRAIPENIPNYEQLKDIIDSCTDKECREWLDGINWESESRAVFRPKAVNGAMGGVRPFYLELSTELSEKEALDYVKRAVEAIYSGDDVFEQMEEIGFDYSFFPMHQGPIKKTDWADMLFIYDYIELYGNERHELTEPLINELRDEYERIGYQQNIKKELGIGPYSLSGVRNKMAEIRQSIETLKDYKSEERPKVLRCQVPPRC